MRVPDRKGERMQVVAGLRAEVFVGIDWASEDHVVCIVDDAGRTQTTFSITHSKEGFRRLVARLAALGEPNRVPVAVERPDGRLVDRLLEAGHAEVIAEYLRLRAHRLAVVEPFSSETRALRAVVRARDDLVRQRVRIHNQLEACLDAFWPGAKVVFADVTSDIALAFLERYPTPGMARVLGDKRMQAFMTKHGYCGRRSPAELLGRLRAAPDGIGEGPEAEARRDAVLGYVGVVRALNASIKALTRSVAAHLGEHPDSEIFTSLPRSGQVNAAQMLAEWGDCREAYDGPEAIAALAGAAPVTKRSGKHKAVSFRWACNTRFRWAITTFADNSRHESPWAAAIYQAAIDRGCDHPHAVRILARAWIRVIYRCWVDRTPYDAARHGGAKRLELGRKEVA